MKLVDNALICVIVLNTFNWVREAIQYADFLRKERSVEARKTALGMFSSVLLIIIPLAILLWK